MVRLDAVLDSWKSIRAGSAQAVDDFPADDLDFRLTPELMTFRELALHILNSGKALAGLLLDGEEQMAGPDFREKIKQYYSTLPADAGAAGLAQAMRNAMAEAAPKLAAQNPEFYSVLISRFDGRAVTRLEMLAGDQRA